MRRLSGLMVVCLCLAVSSQAAADEKKDADQKPSPPAAAADAPPAPSLPASGLSLMLPRLPVDDPEPMQINLFPPTLFGERGTFAPFGAGGNDEKRSGLSLGNDGNWKTHAAQVGAMVGIFAAMVGLCGGGQCMLPEATSSWLPDAIKAQDPVVPSNYKQPELRQLR